MTASRPRAILGCALAIAFVAATIATAALAAHGGVASPTALAGTVTQPNLSVLLAGYGDVWTASGRGDLHGTVNDESVLEHDDELAVWINRHATADQRFRALQDAEYDVDGISYDQSITISTALGSVLGPAYVAGRLAGRLPLTAALLNSSNGTSGAFVTTGTPKSYFSHPRPYLPSDPSTPAVVGDAIGCLPAVVNGSSQRSIRLGKPYADDRGNLDITRVEPTVDTTHRFSPNDVVLDAQYGTTGICGSGSFPSGHTTTAYQAGITLATLLPELAPEILARASEAGNDRIVLGVHSPLDVVGGRISGEAAVAAQWSDAAYRTRVLEPARAELESYLRDATGHSIAWTVAHQTAYRSDPYAGSRMPGGTAQIVTDRASAVAVFTERMAYGFPVSGRSGRAPSVPAAASALLLTTFPSLSDAQRTEVLAQTEIASGYPLDQAGSAAHSASGSTTGQASSSATGSTTDPAIGSWQRLDLAAAMSATVEVAGDGSIHVRSTGGAARVVRTP